ncbi:hypothetical protein [Polyangium jinanense]|uniref:Uncharacterized protein n=1 Tax=Polyangium jinanense TaxID=2829994 RepID=A0A9X4AX08_9BACT|nr:hypothetical protein [Polyangium jinanense]MDC3961558.1 hypothetical protein [Polyangium jinanense]MDC3987923.1 hypothetical protein [Polyangium jinanense]
MPRNKMQKNVVPEASEPAELSTAFALASDGKLYFAFESVPPPDRLVFVGYALRADEATKLGAAGLLGWAMLHKLALGSDGCIYVQEGAIDPTGRDVFRGFAATPEEAIRAAEEIHRVASNVTVEVFASKRAAAA